IQSARKTGWRRARQFMGVGYNDERMAWRPRLVGQGCASLMRDRREESRKMKVATFEAVVENGQIRLTDSVRLPEKARVYVVIPGVSATTYIGSPRLARPEQ